MSLLFLGLALFLGVHLVPFAVSAREALVARLGKNGYRGAFSAVSLLGFVLLIVGMKSAPFVHVFTPPSWGRGVTFALMGAFAVCFAALYLPTNLKRVTAHPMLWGTAFWGAAHLFSNGDLASLALFGGFLVFALLDMWSLNRRGAKPKTERVPASRDAVVVVVAISLYVGLLFLHPYAFGVGI